MKCRMKLILAFVLIATLSTPAGLSAAGAEVEVSLNPSALYSLNLADEPGLPAPLVFVSNRGKEPIEVSVFRGQPDFQMELDLPSNKGAASVSARCGNGYVPYRIMPGKMTSFPLWRDPRWTWAAGRYRIRLSYTVVHPTGTTGAAALSAPFELRLGATRPGTGWREGSAPGEVVVLSSVFSSFLNPPAEQPPADLHQLSESVLPEVRRCVSEAQRRFPWLRGRFGLAFFTTKKDQVWQRHAKSWGAEAESSYNETEFQHSTVGDPLLHSCLNEVRLAKPLLNGSYQIDFALTLEVARVPSPTVPK